MAKSFTVKSYLGIKDKVYRYRINSGMSSDRKIKSLTQWKMVCSAASVFTILSNWSKENQLNEEELEKIRELTRFYLFNNIKQMNETVAPELLAQARQMLCDFWGQSFVERVEKTL